MTQEDKAPAADPAGDVSRDPAAQKPVETPSPARPEGGSTRDTGAQGEAGLETLLAEANTKAEENWEHYLRAAAELENVRRRSAQDLEKAHRFAVERFAEALLDVKDSLEMGLAASVADTSVEVLRDGTEATLKQLTQVFERFGISQVDPAGEAFDPELHEAMSVQESPDVAADRVLTVVQKGYVLNGRLLRPARVIVSRGAAAGEDT